MDQEFINAYIEKMAKKIDEHVRAELLYQTHIEIMQKKIADDIKIIEELSEKLSKFETLHNKKIVKTKDSDF